MSIYIHTSTNLVFWLELHSIHRLFCSCGLYAEVLHLFSSENYSFLSGTCHLLWGERRNALRTSFLFIQTLVSPILFLWSRELTSLIWAFGKARVKQACEATGSVLGSDHCCRTSCLHSFSPKAFSGTDDWAIEVSANVCQNSFPISSSAAVLCVRLDFGGTSFLLPCPVYILRPLAPIKRLLALSLLI